MPPRMRSPDKLGLTMHSTKSPTRRAADKVARLRSAPLGDYQWRDLAEEFDQYADLFGYNPNNLPCRCGHFKSEVSNASGSPQAVLIHIPDPMEGERACQPSEGPCPCKGYDPDIPKTYDVAKAAYDVRRAARRARDGKAIPRFSLLEHNMRLVYKFVQGG